jgi:transposase
VPMKRLSMRKIREILRLRWGQALSARQVASSLKVSRGTVANCVSRAGLAGLSWPLPDDLDDAALEALLYPPTPHSSEARFIPDWTAVHRELRRKHVTLQLLWEEYKRDHPEEGYEYSQYCHLYREFRGKLDVVMRQQHRAGEKAFIDFSGDGIDIVNPKTGEVWEAELYVAVLGASSYTYAEATVSQELRWWIEAHLHTFEYFGGVPKILVPDNLRSAVTRPCLYEPDLNHTYQEMADYYDTAVIPARSQKPKDKAKVEGGVLIAQRWILAALRNHTFFSLQQANQAIAAKLEELNNKRFQKLDTTRRELFETVDRPALQPLPPTRYEFADWSSPKVNIDYHVEIDRHYYSVPYQLIHKRMRARWTTTTVEIFFKRRRVAVHRRSYVVGVYTTVKEHMPKAHQQHLEWTPTRIIRWAEKTGPQTALLIQTLIESKAHPEQGYRASLGILRQEKAYSAERLEAACSRALDIGSVSLKAVKSILKTGMDRLPAPSDAEPQLALPIDHDNVRGPDYYQ